jgi:hypothetical protein
LLLQRLVHTDTRAVVRVRTLGEVFAPKLEEVELLESWLETLVPDGEGDDIRIVLADETAEFDRFLSASDSRLECSPRALLESDLRRGEGRRLIEAEIERRLSAKV